MVTNMNSNLFEKFVNNTLTLEEEDQVISHLNKQDIPFAEDEPALDIPLIINLTNFLNTQNPLSLEDFK